MSVNPIGVSDNKDQLLYVVIQGEAFKKMTGVKMDSTNQQPYAQFQSIFSKAGLITAVPLAILFGLGMKATLEKADENALEFGTKSEFHKIAIEHYRECNKTILDSKTQCLSDSLYIAEKTGATDINALTSDLTSYSNAPNPTVMEILKRGFFYLSVEE
jgi:hypothetical protein